MAPPVRYAPLLVAFVALASLGCDKKEDARKEDKKEEKREDKRDDSGRGEVRGPVTNAVTLLEYQDWSDAPAFCRKPAALLRHLDDVLNSDDCEAQRIGKGDRAKLLLTCQSLAPAEEGAANCKVEYDGRLWIERQDNSNIEYTLYGQGNLSRVCTTDDGRKRAVRAKDNDKVAQRRATRRLEEELEPCEKP
jgi:hypothetical protein